MVQIIQSVPQLESFLRTELFTPYFFPSETLEERKGIALLMLLKSCEELLLMDPYAFQADTILAGLRKDQLEFLALRAPEPIKRFLLEGFSNKETLESAYRLAVTLPENPEEHKERMFSLIRYMQDNELVFRFE